MAAITPTNTFRESMGSLTLLIAQMTTSTSKDTYTIAANSPVVDFWTQSKKGNGFVAPDVTWTPATGIFTITGGTTAVGPMTLYILERT